MNRPLTFYPLLLAALVFPFLPSSAEPVFISRNGMVAIEAESFQFARGWKVQNYYTGIGISPSTDMANVTDSVSYRIEFEIPGSYTVHLLGCRKSNAPRVLNAVDLILYDSLNRAVDHATAVLPGEQALLWSSSLKEDPGEPVRLEVPGSGSYTLDIQVSDGEQFILDKMVFAADPAFRPSGTGPVQTLRDPSPAEELERNRIILPPRWAFGVLYGGYTDQKATMEVIDTLILGDFPIDAYWIDSYFWDFNGGKGPRGYLDFVGDRVAFPDLKNMWGSFEERNIKAGIWIWNMILENGNEQAFSDFLSRGFFTDTFRYTSGWHNASRNTTGGSVDFENPEAAAYWKSRLKPFFLDGLDFLKLDNSSAIDFCRTAFEATQEMGLESGGRGFILAHVHTTYDYRHKLYPTKWTGDAKIAWTQPDYPDLSMYAMGALKENIEMVADPGRTTYEVPFLSHDAGGYDYFGSTDQSEELYMRWIQFASMNSIMMFFSTNKNPTRNHPYRYSETVQENFRKYTHQRMRLFPYLYTYAIRSYQTGEKMIRGNRENGLQFMLGDEILVAPVYEKGAVTRKIVLPPGNWIDPETGDLYEGNREITMDAPVTRLPMLFGEGAIIPLRNYARAIELGNNDTLTLEIYPSADESEFVLLEDDGISNEYLDGKIASTRFTVQRTGISVVFRIDPVEGSFMGMSPERYYILRFHNINPAEKILVNAEKYHGSTEYDKRSRILNFEIGVNKSESCDIQLIY
jgi:hypothetical protein